MSPRPARPWFRFYVEAFRDPKVRILNPAHRWLWVSLLGLARQSPTPGVLMLTDKVALNDRDIADFAGLPLAATRVGLERIQSMGMIHRRADDAWVVTNWAVRQFETDLSRSNIPEQVRLAVIARDGGACVDCGVAEGLTLDHIIPLTKGGTDDEDNLQVMCGPCNSRKGNRLRQRDLRRRQAVTGNAIGNAPKPSPSWDSSADSETQTPDVVTSPDSLEVGHPQPEEKASQRDRLVSRWCRVLPKRGHAVENVAGQTVDAILQFLDGNVVDEMIGFCERLEGKNRPNSSAYLWKMARNWGEERGVLIPEEMP